MGIKGFPKIFKEYSIEINGLEKYNGKHIAIDTSIFLYKFKYQASNSVFLKRFENQLRLFIKYCVTPIYIFDGKPPIEKKTTIEKRKKLKENNDNIPKITEEDITSLKELFDSNSVKYFHPEIGEGETLCSYLNKKGFVDAVLSNDCDALLFGCNTLLLTNGYNKYLELNIDDILENLDMSLEMLIDACIASGTDYHNGIHLIGPKKGIKFAKEKGKIEKWGINIPEDLDLNVIRNLFTDLSRMDVYSEKINEIFDAYNEE